MPILTFTSGPNTGRKKYILRRISDEVILGRNLVYPNATDDATIEGLDADLEYLAMYEDAKPTPDLRVFSISGIESKATTAPYLNGSLPTWRTAWTTAKLPADTIKIHAANAMAIANTLHYTQAEREQISLLGPGLAARKHAGVQLNAAELALDERITALYAVLFANDQRLTEIYTEIDANQTPDLDAGWQPAPQS